MKNLNANASFIILKIVFQNLFAVVSSYFCQQEFEFDWLELMQRKNMAYGHYEKSVCANFLHVTNR